MEVPFTWFATSWYVIGWSEEFEQGQSKPLHYFGEELVGYRDDNGEIHVLTGHCKHLGAHLGHGGKVVGDCIECPFHGWRWGPDGKHAYMPSEPGRTMKTMKLRSYPIHESHGVVFMWYHPHGEAPRWAPPDIFTKFPEVTDTPDMYYRSYPEFSVVCRDENVHPQIVAENAPDSAHFRYVHNATVTPICLKWEIEDNEWQFLTGWPDVNSSDPDAMSLRVHSHIAGLGYAITAFEGVQQHRLIFACTPTDQGKSDLFYKIWWPKPEGETSDVPPPEIQKLVEKRFLQTVWDDLSIWRYQNYVERPPLDRIDAKPYMAMRKWALQFYDVDADWRPGDPPQQAEDKVAAAAAT